MCTDEEGVRSTHGKSTRAGRVPKIREQSIVDISIRDGRTVFNVEEGCSLSRFLFLLDKCSIPYNHRNTINLEVGTLSIPV